MSRSRSYQRSRRDGAERYHNGQLMRRQYADVDHYAAYAASAGPARAPAVEREAAACMLAACVPGQLPPVSLLRGASDEGESVYHAVIHAGTKYTFTHPVRAAWLDHRIQEVGVAKTMHYMRQAGLISGASEMVTRNGGGCAGAPFAMPEPIQPLGIVELRDRLEKMGYSHWDSMHLAMKIVRERAGLAPEDPDVEVPFRNMKLKGVVASFTVTIT